MISHDPGRGLQVAHLPSFAFSHRSVMWWGTLGMIAIEGTVFALLIVSYFYARSLATSWPMTAPPPELRWGTLNLLIMLASLVPNQLAKKAAEKESLGQVRLWLWVCILVGALFLGVRVLEFQTLNVRWDSNAYGSLVWVLLGFHTAHLLTDWLDTLILAVLFHTGPLDGKRYVDVSENSFYWYFVVGAWLPIYFTLYWGARALGT